MKHVLIVENGPESLKINESASNSNKTTLNGIFTEFDIENRNRRFYTAENFVPCMNRLLEKRNMLGVLFGELNHPDNFDIDANNASHVIENLTYNQSSNRIDGQITLLSTPKGQIPQAIINDGYPIFVSSRAAGVTDSSGNVALKELFTYDIVLDPGFASAKMSVNESLGFDNIEVPYRIYEMNDSNVNNLFNDNKNDRKTKMDLKLMEATLATELAKLENKIISQIGLGKTSPEEIKATMEKYDAVNDELAAVKEYLEVFKKQLQHVVKQNTTLVESNKKLTQDINEQITYSNHLSSSLKKLNKYANELNERVELGEKMIEYVAEHADQNINETKELTKFVEYVANETKVTQQFAEHVANETKVAQDFAEYVANESLNTRKFAEYSANETFIAQKFIEYVANETKTAQEFAEYIANESNGSDVYLGYIANKVDGIIGYTNEAISKIKNTTALNENTSTIGIHSLETIVEYLGIDDEQAVVNNIEDVDVDETEAPENVLDTDIDFNSDIEDTDNHEDVNDITPEQDGTLQDTLVNALVKIVGTDDTGIVINVEGDKITIQKSGDDATQELSEGEYEVIDTEENLTETVHNVLAEIKKQKVLSNTKPHFFNFLNEQQVADFHKFEKNIQESIILTMNESEYMSSEDVLSIIGSVLNSNKTSYEENLVNNLPENLKESWNALTKDQMVSVISEAKYFPINTTSDIHNFWNTRPFAKATISPEAILIKESIDIKNGQDLNPNYIDAFLESIEKFK